MKRTTILALLPKTSMSLALLCLIAPMGVLAQVYDVAKNQKLATPVSSYQEAQAERLRQEQLRLENERLRIENERRQRQDQLAERDQLQRQESTARTKNDSEDDEDSAASAVYIKLTVMDKLRKDGLLTDAEFDALKIKILEEYAERAPADGPPL